MQHRTTGRNPPEATLAIGPTLALPEVLRNLGADPTSLLAEAGFDLELFSDPTKQISYIARGHLLAHCVAKTRCQHLGLLVGQRAGLHSLGLVGLLMKYSPDVGTALRNLVRYLHLHIRGGAPTLTVDGGWAVLGYQVYQPHAEATDQVGDGSVAVIFNIMRGLCGSDWKPSEAWFAHREPEDVQPFRRFFQVHLRFDAEQYALVFSAAWLNRPLGEADPDLRRLLQKEIDALEARHGDDVAAQVRSFLRSAIPAGHAKAAQAAALFSIHSRTLDRRLKTLGTSYQALLDESRFEMSRQMLEDSTLDLNEIAALLNYADARSFIRGFRRWSGTTPARWRAMRFPAKTRAARTRSNRASPLF